MFSKGAVVHQSSGDMSAFESTYSVYAQLSLITVLHLSRMLLIDALNMHSVMENIDCGVCCG